VGGQPAAQFLNLCYASVCDRPESFKPRPQMLQFATLAKTAHEGLPVDGSDGFQHPCGHVGQLAKRLLGRREETLEFGDGGRSLLAFDADRLVAAHGVSSNPAGFLLDCRRERAASASCSALAWTRAGRSTSSVSRAMWMACSSRACVCVASSKRRHNCRSR
jgi:hypothetical protein